MLALFYCGSIQKNALGRPHGFESATQGTLFFDVARIIAAKRPRAFMLENVKNLLSHDRGHTFEVIRKTLEQEQGRQIFWKVIDGRSWTAQHRERIIIVGFREKTDFSWEGLEVPDDRPTLKTILHPEDGAE